LHEPPPEIDPGPDDVPIVVLDPSATERAFGWRAQYGLEDTIKRMFAWYDTHGVLTIYSHLKAPANTAA
jgi:UDP-glucose 4-epimerase